MNTGFIGCGNMAKALIDRLIESNTDQNTILVASKYPQDTQKYKNIDNIHILETNTEVAKISDRIILAIKPDAYENVITEINSHLKPGSVCIGITPAYSIEKIRRLLNRDDIHIVRTMPNTPAIVGSGVTAIAFEENTPDSIRKQTLDFFNTLGFVYQCDENLMPAMGSLSASSPAFILVMLEAMAQAAIKLGINANDAYQIAARTFEGTAKMLLQTDKHPALLRDAVASPAGTTIEGLIALEKGGFKAAIIDAMTITAEKFNKMQN